MIASNHATEEEEQLSSRQIGVSLTIALVAFVAIFVLGPTTLFVWLENRLDAHGVLVNIAEGVFRVALFVGYLWLIGRTKDIHRVFEYHGAEHKTIAAYEHDEELVPERIDALPEGARALRHELPDHRDDHHGLRLLDVRDARLVWRLLSRVIAIPIIAGVAYEALRLGARFPRLPADARADAARDLAAEDHDAGARRRPDRGGGRLVPRGAASRGRCGRDAGAVTWPGRDLGR